MATNILMPALSPTMTEGTLARWLKQEGDTITAGDVIAEIETDKATMEVEAVDEGVLGKILVADGTAGVQVNAPIAILVEAGESVPSGEAPAATPAPSPAPVESAPTPVAAAPLANGHDPQPSAEGQRLFVSPLARRLAKQAGIALEGLKGSGPNGRIIKADIETALAHGTPASAPAALPAPAPAPAVAAAPTPAPAAPPPPKPAAITAPHKLIPHTTMRKVVARRLTESKQLVPHFYLTADIEIDALMKLRADLNAKTPKDGPSAFKLSVNDLVIKAVAAALRRVPDANATWTDEGIAMYDDVDISVAVAIEGGLITPIIRKADQKGVATISNEMKDLAAPRPRREAEAGGVPGWRVLDLEPWHVRREVVQRDHQSAAGWHPGRRRRGAAAGGEGWCAGDRNGDELHDLGGSPGGGWCGGGRMDGGVQGHRAGPA